MEEKKLIAVYGTLRLGQGNYKYLLDNKHSKHLGTTTVDNNFTLVDYTGGGGFPAVIHHKEGKTPIVVDVFEVTMPVARSVDSLEGYHEKDEIHTFYDRMSVDTEFGKADIYFMTERALNRPIIDHGDWVKYKEELIAQRV